MKVMFIIPSMAGGGAERVISILANEFTKKGIETKIMMTAGKTSVYQLHPEVELLYAGEKTGGKLIKRFARIFRMRKIFKCYRDHILIAFEPDAAFFAGIAKLGLSMKMIASERNDPRSFGSSRVRKAAYGMTEKIVFQTRDAMECFQSGIQKKGKVIPNPISSLLPEPYVGKRQKTVVSIGRMEEQKNHRLLLRAFKEFAESYPEYTLHLYGKGALLEELKQLAGMLNIEDKVIFEGFHKDVLQRVADAGMYVLSSDYEGISNSLLEAMAIGLPVISTDCPCGGSRLCIQNEINGLLVPVADEKALATAMKRIAQSEELGNQLSSEAVKVRSTFSVEQIVSEWLDVLNETKQ